MRPRCEKHHTPLRPGTASYLKNAIRILVETRRFLGTFLTQYDLRRRLWNLRRD